VDLERLSSETRPAEVGFHHGRAAEQTQGVRVLAGGCLGARIDAVDQLGSDGGLSLGAIRRTVFVARTKNCASALSSRRACPARYSSAWSHRLAADETLDDVEIHAVEEQVRSAVAASVRPSGGTCPVVAAR